MHCLPWTRREEGSHVARAALIYLQTQVEAGHGCPITMSFASIPALRQDSKVAKQWLPRITSTLYDPGNALVSDAFCATRLDPGSGHVYGLIPAGFDCDGLIQRAYQD